MYILLVCNWKRILTQISYSENGLTSLGFASTQCNSPEDNTLYKLYRESIKFYINKEFFFNLNYNKLKSNNKFKFPLLVLIFIIMQVYLHFRYATASFEMFQAPNIVLNVEVIEAKDLKSKDANGKSILKFSFCKYKCWVTHISLVISITPAYKKINTLGNVGIA
jgi:hypothetical protein